VNRRVRPAEGIGDNLDSSAVVDEFLGASDLHAPIIRLSYGLASGIYEHRGDIVSPIRLSWIMHWLQSFLDAANKTQADLARHLNIPGSRVSEMARGIRRLQPKEIAPTAAFLGVEEHRILALVQGRPDPGPRHEAAVINTAGRRLRGIRTAICPDLPARIGIASEVAWEVLINGPAAVDPRLAQLVAAETRLPLGYIMTGDTAELTLEQATALLEAALLDDPTRPPAAPPQGQGRGENRRDRAAIRRRSGRPTA